MFNNGWQPSKRVFDDMINEVRVGRENPDGADQGFIGSYFPELLNQPMFYPPSNGSILDGNFRLPLGYQMDATYYCKSLLAFFMQPKTILGTKF